MLAMDSNMIRVAIVDDHELVRAGIKKILSQAKDISVVGEGADGQQALQLAKTHDPDIMLLDVEMPVMKGDEAARRISQEELRVRVLAVSSYNDPAYIKAMMENGAVGYLTKDEVPGFLISTIRDIAQNEMKWARSRLRSTLNRKDSKAPGFTRRQLEILEQLGRNIPGSEIARSMGLKRVYLDRHIQLLMQKLGVDKLIDLRRIAGQLRFVLNPE
jgi:DNA-binding NarL/FixJ family response regulator